MKKLIPLILITFATGFASAQVTFTESGTPDALHLYRSNCKDGYCFGTLVKVADPSDPGAAPTKWRERMRWTTAQVQAFLDAGVIVDEAQRPGSLVGANPYPVTDAGPLSP